MDILNNSLFVPLLQMSRSRFTIYNLVQGTCPEEYVKWQGYCHHLLCIIHFLIYHLVQGTCPEEYIEWRGHCYRYYEWVRRHYQKEEYTWQETWQWSLEKCEGENATHLSVYDDEEAYFLKVGNT